MHMKRPSVACVGPSCEGCASPECMAEGGAVGSGKNREDFEKGVHKSLPGSKDGDAGYSNAGADARMLKKASTEGGKRTGRFLAKDEHRRVLGEQKDMPKPKLMAEGGCVGPSCMGCSSPSCMSEGGMAGGDGDSADDELTDKLGEEMCSAFEAKDKKRIMSAIEAAVLSVMARGGDL